MWMWHPNLILSQTPLIIHRWDLFPPSILLTPTIPHDHTPQLTPISSTHSHFPPKVFCPTYGRQFINQGLICHHCFCQAPNSSNSNPYGHHGSIPSFAPTLHTLSWIWVVLLDVLKSFHLKFCHLRLYNHIPTDLWHDVQMAFRFPLDKQT